MRYRLDDLGWFHFEKLVQSVLKAELGLAVESWGGHSDLGRDAYTRARLPFPSRSTPTEGPFIFQAKFVQGANAAGSNWRSLLLKAISGERVRIARRRDSRSWREPRQYILLTNCPLTMAAREAVECELQQEMHDAAITQLGGSDICDLLDKHPALRRSFPEILSLRDLDLLISEAVSKQILERSRAAVEESRDLVPVFVPTQAYHRAWKSLQRHSSVVLDGPPEMGKTAIARTIALGHLLSDWQAIDCRDPNDLFSVFTDGRNQVFVADDAFGRTEYDPVLGRMWERDLPRVFHCLDSRHRLIWTTRKHILMRALREIDLTGRASRFPKPGEVLVTADDLSIEEKSRILYRHAKTARLNDQIRTLVRRNASTIVSDKHFTPERIRRFVRDLLPDVAARAARDSVTHNQINEEIREAIRNPTDRMRKSFRKLHSHHRWILIAFLECDGPVQPEVLRERFASHRGSGSAHVFDEALDDVLGTFLKHGYGVFRWHGKRIDWIHPSYRDLVIDELSHDPQEQSAFLKHASTSGIKLALSRAGGKSGEREMPLVSGEESWNMLDRRCREIASGEDDESVSELLHILANAMQTDQHTPSDTQARVSTILRSVCKIAVERWDDREDEPIDFDLLQSFHRATDGLRPRPTQPRADLSWLAITEEVRIEIDSGYISDPSLVNRWFQMAELIEDRYPNLAQSPDFRAARTEVESGVFEIAEEQAQHGARLRDPESNEFEGRRVEELAEALSAFDRDGSRDDIIARLFGRAEEYKENGPPDEEEEYEEDGRDTTGEGFDIDALFEDL